MSVLPSSQDNPKRRKSTFANAVAEVATEIAEDDKVTRNPSKGDSGGEEDGKGFEIYGRQHLGKSAKKVMHRQMVLRRLLAMSHGADYSSIKGGNWQTFEALYVPEAENKKKDKKKKKKKKTKKKKTKSELEGGASSNLLVADSNFFEEPFKAWGGERKSTNMSRCETGTGKGEMGGM